MIASPGPRFCAALVTLLTCSLIGMSPGRADAVTVEGDVGTLSVTTEVDVYGSRCGTLKYHWDGWGAQLNWSTSSWVVYLYEGGPDADPFDIGYNMIDAASGTAPWVSGVDDDPSFSGQLPICAKADSTRPLTLWGTWGGYYDDGTFYEDEVSLNYVVDYHPVVIKMTKTARFVKARVLRDGRGWAGKTVQVKGLTPRAQRLRTNSAGVVKVERTKATRHRTVRFALSDIARSGPIRL